MTIALDFDGTWTVDPGLWRSFRSQAMSRGHNVVMVTARRDPISPEESDRYALPPGMPVIYTGGDLKEASALKQGVKVDVWIDDLPGMIQHTIILPTSPDHTL